MFVQSIDISRFRNLEDMHLEFAPGFNVFYGDNAQGKSNLLEAVYVLAFLKGFRADRIPDMIRFDQERAQLSAVVCDGNAQTRLGMELTGRVRHAYIDGVPCNSVRSYLGILRAILFVPMDVGFMQAPPANRRSALDRMVFNLHPSYLVDLDQYQKVCKQKSAVLRSDTPDHALLDAYDEQLLKYGERIIRFRYDYFNLMAPHICRVFASIFDDSLRCLPVYKCSQMRSEIVFGAGNTASCDDLVGVWRDYIRTSRDREIARQQILAGPHRDDWSLNLDGRQAKLFASQGQQRAMSLALKLAEIDCLKSEAGVEPVFLLDDVSSELDPVRNRKLFEHLNRITVQTFLTTTSKQHLSIDCVNRLFMVKSGSITCDA